MRTASKRSVTSQSHDGSDEKSRITAEGSTSTSALKRVHKELCSKRHHSPLAPPSIPTLGPSISFPAPSSPLGPSGLTHLVPPTWGRLLRPTLSTALMLPFASTPPHSRPPPVSRLPSPANELLVLHHSLLALVTDEPHLIVDRPPAPRLALWVSPVPMAPPFPPCLLTRTWIFPQPVPTIWTLGLWSCG